MQAPALRWWSAGAIPAGTAWRRPGGAVFFTAPSTCCSPFLLQAVTTGIGALLGVGGSFDLLAKMPPVLWGLLLVAPTAVAVLDKARCAVSGPRQPACCICCFCSPVSAAATWSRRSRVLGCPSWGLCLPSPWRRPPSLAASGCCTRRWGTNRKRTVHLDNSAQLH